MSSRVIGIDLGTSSSLVAVLDGGKPRLIADRQGRTVMPSLIVIKDDRSILVGHDAESEARKYSEKNLLIASLKRSMGRRKEYGLHDAKMPVQVLAALILSELKIRAEDYLGESVEYAVIAVPANFSFSQRQFTKEAALIAGLKPLRIVNEATASVCASADYFEGKVIVADLGGGTFDVSIVDFVGDHIFQVVATSGDRELGGEDFTTEIAKLVLSKIGSQFDRAFLQADPITFQRLTDAVEDLKKQLTSSERAEMKLPYVCTRNLTYETLTCTITRKEFETACEPLFSRIEKIVERVASEARLWKPAHPVSNQVAAPSKATWLTRIFSRNKTTHPNVKISQSTQTQQHPVVPLIWMIGNASRIPEIKRRLSYKYRSWHPPGMLDLKEPVALGAARIAGILEGTVKDTLLIDVTPNTLSIETQGGVSTPIIPRNTTTPASRNHTFTTVQDNQTTIAVKIHEGERPLAKDNTSLGTLHIENLPLARAGIPKIEVRFDVDANGVLCVTGTDLATKKASRLRCSELVLSEKKLNEYHLLVQKWSRQRREIVKCNNDEG